MAIQRQQLRLRRRVGIHQSAALMVALCTLATLTAQVCPPFVLTSRRIGTSLAAQQRWVVPARCKCACMVLSLLRIDGADHGVCMHWYNRAWRPRRAIL